MAPEIEGNRGSIAPVTNLATGSSENNGSDIPQSTAHNGIPLTRDFVRAANIMSIWGPCRQTGDSYLACVVTDGMGMCRGLRSQFEKCVSQTFEPAVEQVEILGMQVGCDDMEDGEARLNCAAKYVNGRLP